MDDFKDLYIRRNLADYVQVYDDALSAEVCESLISSFDADDRRQLRENQYMYFMENNVSRNDWDLVEVYQSLLDSQSRYLQDQRISEIMIGRDIEFEELRMRKYRAGLGDHFYPHVDVVGTKTTSRILTYHWFLNDSAAGDLEFLQLDRDLRIEPRRGRLVVFPSTWQYLYQILEPTDTDVYTMTGHQHYQTNISNTEAAGNQVDDSTISQ